MSELPDGVPPAREPTPRDSAAGIVLRPDPAGGWQVLLGARSRRARFMPGQLSFPGGVLEQQDRPGEDGAWARCASRELREETGIDVPATSWIEAGERITPSMFSTRFRARFFIGAFPAGKAEPRPASEELEELRFVRAADAVADWERGATQLPPPVLSILRALAPAVDASLADLAGAVAEANLVEERSPRIEFLPGLWMVPVKTATLPPATHTNVWMPGGRRFAIVDPGCTGSAELDRLCAVVHRRSAGGDRPHAVLLTHHHRDHTGGAARLARRLGLPLLAHPEVLSGLESAEDLDLRPIDEGQELDLQGVRLRALWTPGHAPAHLAFHLPEQRALVAGDLLSGTSTILIDPDCGDMAAYRASLERVRSLNLRLLLPGHGPPLPGRALDRLIRHRTGRERRILALLGRTASGLDEIARGAYDEASKMPLALLERQTLSHLIELERGGRARRMDVEGRRWIARPTEGSEGALSSGPARDGAAGE